MPVSLPAQGTCTALHALGPILPIIAQADPDRVFRIKC